MRAIRSKDYKLILNLMPERPWCQYNKYKEGAYPMLAELNIMNLKGQLTSEQAAFLAPCKSRIELFDLRRDPREVKNVADDPRYAQVKAEMLAELEHWCKKVIHDQGVSKDFRALGVFPPTCPTSTVDKWVEANDKNYDFNKYGWPAWYPTRTLEEWEKARELWVPYVFREPGKDIIRPEITHSKRKNKKKNDKFEKSKKLFVE